MKKILYSLFVFGMSLAVLAEDPITFPGLGDWNDNPLLKEGEAGTLQLSRDYASVASTRIFRIDPARRYRLSGSFRMKEGSNAMILLALRVYDRNRLEIKPNDVCPVSGTDTVTAAPCRIGDRFILVKDASAIRRGVLVYDTAEDLSDLPNRKQITGIRLPQKQPDGNWKIPFAQPVGVSLPAGTRVRAHYGYLPQITGGRHRATPDWRTFSGEVSGMTESGPGDSKWRRGTAFAQVLLIKNGKNSTLEFKDIRWEEIPGKAAGTAK